jgi:hypothetical protein
MPPRRTLWAGPGARRTLAAGGAGTVEYAVRPGGYVRLGDEWLLLATPRSPRGPLTVIVTGLERAPLVPGDEVRVEGGALIVGGETVAMTAGEDPRGAGAVAAGEDASGAGAAAGPGDVARAGAAPAVTRSLHAADVRAALSTAPSPPATVSPPAAAALGAALSAAPAPPGVFAAGLAALRRGDHAAAVASLAGRGPGLTPAGDDILAGYAARRHAAGLPAAPLASPRCSPLGLAYLRCAERGELAEPVLRLLDAVTAGDVTLARRRTAGLARWGATSGAAILWGFAAA